MGYGSRYLTPHSGERKVKQRGRETGRERERNGEGEKRGGRKMGRGRNGEGREREEEGWGRGRDRGLEIQTKNKLNCRNPSLGPKVAELYNG